MSKFSRLCLGCTFLLAAPLSIWAQTAPAVKIVGQDGAFKLYRNGSPYFIKGAGGDGSKTVLHDLGGNSFRTWGADNAGPLLDEAQKLGMTVTLGIWLGHKGAWVRLL